MKTYLLNTLLFTCLLTAVYGFTSAKKADPTILIQVCKQKEQTVRLLPNTTYSGTLSVVSASKAPLHFYIFDVEGTILFHTLLQPGSKRTVDALKKGVYSYDVFRQDEGVEQGKITVL